MLVFPKNAEKNASIIEKGLVTGSKGYENHTLKYVKGETNLSLSILKGLLLKCFEETRLMAISFTC